MKMEVQKNKDLIRARFIKERLMISEARHRQAKQNVANLLAASVEGKKCVLSYYPLPNEVDVSCVNEVLSRRGGLALPRMENQRIVAYLVRNIKEETQRGAHGFFEPIKSRCEKAGEIEVALIPGIAFDANNNRIGFGHGHYDYFLKGKEKILKIGIAFQEQISKEVIPVEAHDIPVDELCIV